MASSSYFAKRARTIPLRLKEEERSLLRVLEGAMAVSEYSDKVDIFSHRSKLVRIEQQLGDVFAIISGLYISAKGKQGQNAIEGKRVSENPDLFRSIFEVGRRYKVMNPDRMRSSYGKLMFMLMDAQSPEVTNAIGFRCVTPVLTVVDELQAIDALEMLENAEDLGVAVAPLRPGDPEDARERKAEAMAAMIEAYGQADAETSARVERVLLSIADDEALTHAHVEPVERMLKLLRDNFDPSAKSAGASLAITAGKGGARLSHSHAAQFAYVEQSLELWREILSHLSQMWSLAEADLLSGSGYRLRDTGQGMHRVMGAPHVGRFMSQMLQRMQSQVEDPPAHAPRRRHAPPRRPRPRPAPNAPPVRPSQVRGGWVGSSAVHLGDNDVPNALVWIDKYTQIPRILTPILETVAALDGLGDSGMEGGAAYVNAAFGSADAAKRAILLDFFKHGFDGSGADNFYDAGSCIDGRLTSAWNWCSKLAKKPFFHVFKMAGFVGFDGAFK